MIMIIAGIIILRLKNLPLKIHLYLQNYSFAYLLKYACSMPVTRVDMNKTFKIFFYKHVLRTVLQPSPFSLSSSLQTKVFLSFCEKSSRLPKTKTYLPKTKNVAIIIHPNIHSITSFHEIFRIGISSRSLTTNVSRGRITCSKNH